MKNKMLRQWWKLILTPCLLLSFVLFAYPSHALLVKDIPNPRVENGGWVTDMVDMLSPSAEDRLNQMISDLENKNGTEIAVVTVPTTQPASTPKVFATELFNSWGIGKKGINNGILFLVSQGDRRTEITTGYGIEAILTNAKIEEILKTNITPEFKKGNFENGIIAGTEAIIQELNQIKIFPPPVEVDKGYENVIWTIFFTIISITILIVISLIFSEKTKGKKTNSRHSNKPRYRSSSISRGNASNLF